MESPISNNTNDIDDAFDPVNNRNYITQPKDVEDEDLKDPGMEKPGERLLWACQTNQKDIVEDLLNTDASLINFQDSDGYSALHRACYSNHLTIAKILIRKYGADLHKLTEEGWTPLHSAARWNAAECVELLLQEGADANHLSKGNQTPLHLATFNSFAKESLQLLMMVDNLKGNVKNCQDDSPLDLSKRDQKCVEMFDTLDDAAYRVEED